MAATGKWFFVAKSNINQGQKRNQPEIRKVTLILGTLIRSSRSLKSLLPAFTSQQLNQLAAKLHELTVNCSHVVH